MSTTAEYLQELARGAGLSDEEKAALAKVLANQKFVEEVGKGVARQSDYSRNMDALSAAKAEFETKEKTWRDWYAEATARDAQREEELQALRAKNGNTNPNPNPNPAPAAGLTEKQLAEREGRMIAIAEQMGRISSRHAAQFHEELDVDAVEKIAIERGLTVDKAYEEFIKPRVQAAEKASHEEALKKAREEGVQEGLSKRDVPSEGERAFHPMFRKPVGAGETDPTKLTDRQRADNFASAWATEAAKK